MILPYRKEEFLDSEFIVAEIFKRINEAKPDNDPDFCGVKHFLTKIQDDLFELKSSFDLDFLQENSPGNKYLSPVVFSKLHGSFKKELIHHVDTNYPSLSQIFANYSEVIETLVYNTESKSYNNSNSVNNSGKTKIPKVRNSRQSKNRTSENFNNNTKSSSNLSRCKFCNDKKTFKH